MRKIYPVLKVITLMIAVALLLFGAYLFWGSLQIFHRFDGWLEARPVDIEVDFSKAGNYESRFEQICSISHGEIIGLEVPGSALSNTDIKILIKGLKANCVITDSNRVEVVSLELPDNGIEWQEPYFGNLVPLNKVHPFKNGTYKISVSVSQGAPGLSGIEQRFVARYQLCGLERMPGVVLRFASIVCFIVGGVIVLTMLLMAVIKARKNSQSAPA